MHAFRFPRANPLRLCVQRLKSPISLSGLMAASSPIPVPGKIVAGPGAFLTAAIIGGITLLVFGGAIHCGFLRLDDDMYVTANPHVSGGWSFPGISYAFSTTEGGSWMPVTWLSYLADTSLWGSGAAGYHATNVILHSVNAGLLFLGLLLLTGETGAAAFVALLFAVHPLRLESVVWIAERKDVLSGFFFMLLLIAYAAWVGKRGYGRGFIVFLCLLLGLMAKPMLVTAPLLLLLLDLWPLRRSGFTWREIRKNLVPLFTEKTPLLPLSFAFCAGTVVAQRAAGAVAQSDMGNAQLFRVADNYWFYLGKILWPDHLNVLYPIVPLTSGPGVLAVAALFGGTAVILLSMPRQPWLTVGWLWFLIALIPVIGVVPIGSTWVADRYTYLPSIGVAIILVWAGRSLRHWLGDSLLVAAGCLTVLLLGCLTRYDLLRWRDSFTLLEDSAKKGGHWGAYLNLGLVCAESNDHRAAVDWYSRAISANSDLAEGYYDRANSWRSLGEPTRAREDYSRAIDLKPGYAEAYNNRGSLSAAQAQWDAAIADLDRAIDAQPGYVEALVNRAHVYQELGRFPEAIRDYNTALACRPASASLYHDRAVAYLQVKDYERAWQDLRRCRELGLLPNPELVRRLEAESGRTQ